MNEFPKLLLDSGDPDEFREIGQLAKNRDNEIWGATTNPSLIAKKLEGKKVSMSEAFDLQKQLVLQIVELVPGAVSAEVYADEKTTGDQMIEQGREIATWHERVVVKLPTTVEGFKARTALRKEKIPTNNTLVFSQEQIFAICLHERIMQEEFGPIEDTYPPFISPFVGRLDDKGENGMDVVGHGMDLKKTYGFLPWMLEASVRRTEHIKLGFDMEVELITAPAKAYREWFALTDEEVLAINPTFYAKTLTPIDAWTPSESLLATPSIKSFMKALTTGELNIQHPLTDAGIARFASDWKTIISNE